MESRPLKIIASCFFFSMSLMTNAFGGEDPVGKNSFFSGDSIQSAVELDIDSNSVRGELYYYQLNESCKLFFHVQRQTKNDEGSCEDHSVASVAFYKRFPRTNTRLLCYCFS